MHWKYACMVAFAAWSVYGFFGERASKIHGDKVNLLFETLAFICLSLVALTAGISDFQKITNNSALNASIMGLLSAGGFWFVLYAMKVAPQEETAMVILISGMFPIGTVAISHFVIAPISITQWIGVMMTIAGVTLANWK